MNKETKKRSTPPPFNARARRTRGSIPFDPSKGDKESPAWNIKYEELDPADPRNCENCPVQMECMMRVKKDCPVYQATRADIDWFIPYWNAQRKKYNSRLPELLFITGKQQTSLRYRQSRYGVAMVRQFVINLMTSDFANGRTGKAAPSNLDFYLECHRFPKVIQGRYNDLEPEARKPTAAELRAQAEEERRLREEQRREESRRIEAEERERKRREREAMFAGAVHGEELKKIWAQISLPPLKPEEKIKK